MNNFKNNKVFTSRRRREARFFERAVKFSKLRAKKVLIFGLGLNEGGVGAAKFFIKAGSEVRITDLKNAEVLQPSLEQLKEYKDVTYTLEKHEFKDIDWADLIIKNPAVKPNNHYISYALEKGKQVETDMGIFLKFVKPSQIIGVTGTKGKSTTASLIYEVLKAEGPERSRRIVFAGNIGKSVLDAISLVKQNTLVVLEISSFQLEAFENHKVSPKWAVITNITPDHLNYYQSMNEYIQAKRVIAKYQTKQDYLFIRKNDLLVDQQDFLKGLQGKIIYFSSFDLPKNLKPVLKGQHNLENIAAAYQIGQVFNINSNLLLQTLTAFKGVPFRMEQVKEWNGVKIYNDTAATSPEAGMKALETLPDCILICGGMNKKMDYTKYAKAVSKFAKQVFFLEGDATNEIVQNSKFKIQSYGIYNNLEKLLEDVKKVVKEGDIILFSPAATSFNLFQNEFDRGRKFNQAVERVFN